MKQLFVALCVMLIFACLTDSRVGAFDDYPDWSSGEPVARILGDPSPQRQPGVLCVIRTITVIGYGRQKLCITEMNGWRYATFHHDFRVDSTPYQTALFVISRGSDSLFYVVDGMEGWPEPIRAPGTDSLVFMMPPHGVLKVFDDFPEKIGRTKDGYRLEGTGAEVRLGSEETYTYGSAISGNGRWLVAETGSGILRVDLSSLAVRLVSSFTRGIAGNFSSGDGLAVSDDGGTIAAAGRPYEQRSFATITVDDSCGTGELQIEAAQECRVNDLGGLFADNSLPDGWPLGLRFTPRGKRLDLTVQGVDGYYTQVSLHPYGSAPVVLRYLALGDSFSSGEGDGDHSFYEAGTDDPATGDVCHTSRRSYPFRLAERASLEQYDGFISFGMRSVACSGAKTGDIDGGARSGADEYTGQDARLDGLSTAMLENRRHGAMDGFIPGRVRQIDFVNEYEPRAVSLDIGGNDVQFSQILALCARSITSCSYANDPTDRRNLGESISGMYVKLAALYERLAAASPSGRVYAVGYPRFINESGDSCPLSTNLDANERRMVDEGVRYLNAVTRAAAVTAGIAYVDIEDALVGHRACDDPGGYVNTIDLLSAAMGHVDPGTFHPNELGHAAISMAIERQLGGGDLAARQYCLTNTYPCPSPTDPPALPSFFGDSSVTPPRIALPSDLLRVPFSEVPYAIARNVELLIRLPSLLPGSAVLIELHSVPVPLADITVNPGGDATATIKIPDHVDAGFHTLHAYGQSPSGEAIDMYQIVYVLDSGEPVGHTTPPGNENANESRADTKDALTTAEQSNSVVEDTIKFLPATIGRYGLPVLTGILPLGGCIFIGFALWRRRAP